MSSQEKVPPPENKDDEWYIDIPDWHKKLLLERLAKYEAEGFVGRPWEEFEKEFMADLDPELVKVLEQELMDDD